jgi:hypothetical protein
LKFRRSFFKGPGFVGVLKNPFSPQKPSHSGESVGEGYILFAGPVKDEGALTIGVERHIDDHDERVQGKEAGHFAPDRVFFTAASGGKSQVGLAFLVGGFTAPAASIFFDDSSRGKFDVPLENRTVS